jgi:4-hydroxybenzoate polyprenyltransferase
MIANLWISMRPRQWVKNTLVFAALIFSQSLFQREMAWKSLWAFLFFCLLSSGVYLLNDLLDAEEDRKHPLKKERPIAAGKVTGLQAMVAAVLLSLISVCGAFSLTFGFGMLCAGYLALQILYSLFLKRMAIIEVFAIAAGFFLRVVGGAKAIEVPISSWLLICTLFFSLFLALGKRRHELILLGEEAQHHRRVLTEYSIPLLDQMVGVATAGTIISYSLYTLSQETVKKFHTESLWYTVPIVLYGIFRYLYLVYRREEGGHPELIFFQDRSLLLTVLLYVTVVGVVLYS